MLKDEIYQYLYTKLKNIPQKPGCYLWVGRSRFSSPCGHVSYEEHVLYVGKAVKLRNRVTQYLNSQYQKIHFMMSDVTDLKWITTNNEMEALLLENNLIKKYSPPFNVRLKDNKEYPFLCITMSEVFPRLILVRKRVNKKDRYFGPFSNVKAARKTMALIHSIFPIRKKNLKLPLKRIGQPCLNFHIKRCWAPCTGQVDIVEYHGLIEQVIRFLEGNVQEFKEDLSKKMHEHVVRLEYEQAKKYKDIMIALEATTMKQQVHNVGVAMNIDIISLFLYKYYGCSSCRKRVCC